MNSSPNRRPAAPRGPGRRAHPAPPRDEYHGLDRIDFLMPGTCRFAVQIDDDAYALQPVARATDDVLIHVRLRPRDHASPVLDLTEWRDTDRGLQAPGFLGLACTCGAAPAGVPCRHVRALVAVGILRPHPGWDDDHAEADPDAVADGTDPTLAAAADRREVVPC